MQWSTPILGFLALLCVVHFSEGQRLGGALQCFDCDMEVNRGDIPLPCRRTKLCDADKYCRVKVEEKEGGRVLRYRYGCGSIEKCRRRDLEDKELCRECCTTHECNTHDTMCQSIGVASVNTQNRIGIFSVVGGPLECLDCDMEVNRGDEPLPCSTMTVCDADKYCRVKVKETDGGQMLRYTYGCGSIEKCNRGVMEDDELCMECCTADVCNTHDTLCTSVGVASASAINRTRIFSQVPATTETVTCHDKPDGNCEFFVYLNACTTDNVPLRTKMLEDCRRSCNFCEEHVASVTSQASSTARISSTEEAAPSITTPQPTVYSSTSVSSVATAVIGSQSSTAAVRVTPAAQQPKFSTLSTTAGANIKSTSTNPSTAKPSSLPDSQTTERPFSSTAGANIKSTSTIPSTAKSSTLSDSQTTERPFSSTAGVDIKSTSTNPSTAKSSTLPDFTNTERSFSSTAGAAIRSTSANPSTAKSSTLPDFTTTDRTVRSTAESCRDAHICTGMKSADGSLDCQRPVMANLCKFSCGNCPAPAFSQASSTAHISSTEGAAPSITTPHTSAAVRETSAAQQPNFSTVSTTEGAAMTDFQTTEVHTCPSIIRQFSCDTDWVAELCLDECQI